MLQAPPTLDAVKTKELDVSGLMSTLPAASEDVGDRIDTISVHVLVLLVTIFVSMPSVNPSRCAVARWWMTEDKKDGLDPPLLRLSDASPAGGG